MIHFTIPGRIRGKGRPRATVRGGFAKLYTDAKTRSDEAMVRHFASQAMTGLLPLTGPLALDVLMFISPPLSWSRKKREAAQFVTGKPDCDNVLKLIGDSLNGIVYADDSQIAQVRMTRKYTLAHEHVSIEVLALTEQHSEARAA